MAQTGIGYVLMVLIFLLTPSHAMEKKDFPGVWVMQVGGRNFFVLTLRIEGDQIRGTWERPPKFSESNGVIYANIHGGIREDLVIQSQQRGETLHLVIQNEKK
jgi:hypothetical protein